MTEYKYAEPQTYLLVNEDDPNLDTIRIDLPPCPPLETIDGYGLPPKEQMWKAPKTPYRIKELERKFDTISEIREYLSEHQVEYQEEIEWIQLQWKRRREGYWFFNCGEPVYVDGWHYFYMSFWNLDVGLPRYRSRDRKFFLFARFCMNDTKDEKGNDLGRRVCFGFNFSKHRREGASYKAACVHFCVITDLFNALGGIQSMDGKSAKMCFKIHYVAPFKKLPFFFKPIYEGSTDPREGLSFMIPPIRKAGLASVERGLDSAIFWAESAAPGYFDGWKLYFDHDDETGKVKLADVYERWQVKRKCLSQSNGMEIHGFHISTSTVGEMSEGGGKSFFELCNKSHYSKRNKIGQTESGLYNLFIPAYDGLDFYIDKYGNSIIEDPQESDVWKLTKVDRDSNGKLRGAKRYLAETREGILLDESPESNARFEEEVRQMPTEFSECFITKGAGSGLNLKKIVVRIRDLQFEKDLTKRVTYEWEKDYQGNPIRFGKVIQRLDPKNGEWIISLDIPEHMTNRRIQTKWFDERVQVLKQCWSPERKNVFTCGSDPFKFTRVQGKRLSNAAASIFWERDESIDPDDKPMYSWESYRTVATYVGRPNTKNEFAEKVLMACIYFGAESYPEIDVPVVWDYFEENGFYGYLKFDRDVTGKVKKTPGFNARASQQELFLATRDYIEQHCDRIRHMEVLESYKSIKGIEDLTNQDLFVAVGGSYMGSRHKVPLLGKTRVKADLSTYFPAKHFY